MKAALLVDVQQFELRDLPDPKVPVDGLVLKVEACGVCGSDLRRWKEGPPLLSQPIVPGHEIAGTVEAVGPGLKDYAIGDRLAVAPDIHCGHCYYCQRGMYNLCDELHFIGITPGYPGGFAEKITLTQEILTNGILHHIPEGISFTDAALSEPCSSVLATHEKIGTGLNHTVLVMGAGPIGCLHVVIAKVCGARVILSEPNPIRRKMAEPFHPDVFIDPDKEDVVSKTRQLTSGLGVDTVICANPIATTQAEAVKACRKAGKVILFGGLPKAQPMTSLDANRIHYGEIVVMGAFSYHPSHHQMALDIIKRGVIPTGSLITHIFPLDKIADAFRIASTGEALKIMVTTS